MTPTLKICNYQSFFVTDSWGHLSKRSSKVVQVVSGQSLGVSGQAMVEYILMLIVSISILLALITQFFKPFNLFLQNYMGSYVQCLLDFGELPSLGSDTGSAKDDGDCNTGFEAFSVAGGRSPKGDGAGADKDAKDKADSKSGSSSRGSGGSSSGGSGGPVTRFPFKNGTSSAESKASKNGKVTEVDTSDSGGSGFFKATRIGNNLSSQRTNSVFLQGRALEDIQKMTPQSEDKKTSVVSKWNQPLKKIPWRKPAKDEKFIEASDKPFSIWEFMRYILIAAIILAIVVFVGGQILQMSRGGGDG